MPFAFNVRYIVRCVHILFNIQWDFRMWMKSLVATFIWTKRKWKIIKRKQIKVCCYLYWKWFHCFSSFAVRMMARSKAGNSNGTKNCNISNICCGIFNVRWKNERQATAHSLTRCQILIIQRMMQSNIKTIYNFFHLQLKRIFY